MMKDGFKDDPYFTYFETPTYEPYENEKFTASKMPYIDDIDDVENYDQYSGAQVRLPFGDEIRSGKFMRPNRELDGTVKGISNAIYNSMLDTMAYEIEFPDERSEEYTANLISENMYAQCDE
jgi:hypothetical protein